MKLKFVAYFYKTLKNLGMDIKILHCCQSVLSKNKTVSILFDKVQRNTNSVAWEDIF